MLGASLTYVNLPPDICVDPNIKGHVVLKRDADEILISGDLEVTITLKCSRCLSQFECSVPVNLDLKAFRTIDEDRGYEPDSELEHNEVFIHNDEIDLGELIVQEISLDIPMKPLCKDDCPGLCPHCGGAIGPDGCSCSSGVTVDPRWEKLVTLKSRLNN